GRLAGRRGGRADRATRRTRRGIVEFRRQRGRHLGRRRRRRRQRRKRIGGLRTVARGDVVSIEALVPLPVVLPMFGAGLAWARGRSARAQRGVSIVVLSLVVAVAAVLLVRADNDGPQVMHVGGWNAPIGISLVADRLSALMVLVSAIVALGVLVYSLGQGVVEYGRDTPLSVFHPTFLVLVAGVSNAFLSGDLFNLYVGF